MLTLRQRCDSIADIGADTALNGLFEQRDSSASDYILRYALSFVQTLVQSEHRTASEGGRTTASPRSVWSP